MHSQDVDTVRQDRAWGYVDQPPLTPLLARVAAALPGGLLPLRLVAIAAQVACIVLTAVLAAEFGCRRCWSCSPVRC